MIHYVTTHGIGGAWIAAELGILQRHDVPFVLHALRKPQYEFFSSEWALRINRETRVIYPLSVPSFLCSQLAAPFLFGRRYFSALKNALFGERESFSNRIRAFVHLLVAAHVSRSLDPAKTALFHAQWAHSGATVAMYMAWLMGKPFSFTGHAVDLFQARVALADKVRRAEFIVCISSFHRQFYISEFGADPSKLITIFCGIDVQQFDYRYGESSRPRPHIVSVGRVIEKKGLADLIDAMGILRGRGVACSCEIGGDGPLTEPLQRQIADLGLQDRVVLKGEAILQEKLSDFLAAADIFAQPCVWSKDNDVDGTPRTLMEAMATGLPSVSTRIAGIPDIIDDGESGLLVEPGKCEELADALQRIIEDPALASRLSKGGRARIEDRFEIEGDVLPLIETYRRYLSPTH